MSSFLLLGAGTDNFTGGGGGGSVTFDAASAMSVVVDTTSPMTFSHTLGATANLILVYVGCRNSNDVTGTVTCGAQTMTLITSQEQVTGTASAGWILVYGLTSPSTGAQTITLNTNSGGFVFCLGAVSFIGANSALATAVPSGSIVKGNSGTTTLSFSEQITTAANHLGMVITHADVVNSSTYSSATTGTTGTVLSTNTSVSGRTAYMIGNAGTNKLTGTVDVADQACGIALDISP